MRVHYPPHYTVKNYTFGFTMSAYTDHSKSILDHFSDCMDSFGKIQVVAALVVFVVSQQ